MSAVDRDPPEADDKVPEANQPVDLDTRELFAGRSEIRIAHDNAVYRLRITRAGKLILNK
jgi:hemin uptake protein HemP